MSLGTLEQIGRRAKAWAERGYTVTFQTTYFVFVLLMFLGLVYDFGGVGLALAVAGNATRLAAQDAAKNIDLQTYINTQQIRLSGNALTAAQNMVDGMTAGKVQVTGVSVNSLATRDVIVVRASVTVKLPVLASVFGVAPINLRVEAYAEPAYGISAEGQ